MQTFSLSQTPFREAISETLQHLQQGNIVLLPTDTVYGLAVLPSFTASIKRLYAMKKRPPEKNLPIMVDSIKTLQSLGVHLSDEAMALLASPLIPGKVTLALGFSQPSDLEFLKERREIAVRIPDDRFLQEVLALTGPLLVTSANTSGAPTLQTTKEILPTLAMVPDLVIDDGPRSSPPSTLVNCNVSPVQIEREGAVSKEDLQNVLR